MSEYRDWIRERNGRIVSSYKHGDVQVVTALVYGVIVKIDDHGPHGWFAFVEVSPQQEKVEAVTRELREFLYPSK